MDKRYFFLPTVIGTIFLLLTYVFTAGGKSLSQRARQAFPQYHPPAIGANKPLHA